DLYGTPGWAEWVRSVRAIQELNRRGTYRIAFFINPSLRRCEDGDYFDRDGPRFEDEIFRHVLSEGTPAGTAFDEFLHYRPSQMPFANGHTMGNSNLVKAQALFGFLRDAVFPAIPALAAPAQ